MAMGDIIQRLAVSLALETAAFEKGATLAQKSFEKTRRSFEKTGKQIQGVGIKMSAAITAPLAAIGVGLARSTTQLVETSREMRVASQVAGESFENFQKLAFGAKTVGIEASKLGDIFKDTQDKVGDFRATGGGGMADFFENIAPKVGVTAEAFKGLSGKDGLQLYYDSLVKANVSSDEMRFYMEAIASDATMLIPLLENGGKAFDEFGKSAAVLSENDAAQLDQYAIASQKMDAALQKLTIALVGSGLLEGLTGLVTKVSEWATAISQVNPEILNWGVGIAAVLAALGPLVAGIGTAISVGSGFLTFLTVLAPALAAVGSALLAILMNPFVLGAAVLIGGIYLAWKNWDKITAIVKNLYNGVKTWMLDKLGSVFDGVKKKIDAVKGFFFNLYDAVVGNSYIPDMVTEIGQNMDRLDAMMVNPAQKAAQKTEDAMREMAGRVRGILDRLYPDIARVRGFAAQRLDLETSPDFSDAGRADAIKRLRREEIGLNPSGTAKQGIRSELDPAINQAATFADVMEDVAKRSKVQTVKIAKSFKDMADDTLGALRNMTDAIKGGGFLDILEGVIGLGMQLGSMGLFGKGIQANINKPGNNAQGTRNWGGGMSWVGERGPELVNMPRGAQVFSNRESMAMGGGKLQVEVVANNNGFGAIIRNHAGQVVAESSPTIMHGGAQIATSRLSRRQSRSI